MKIELRLFATTLEHKKLERYKFQTLFILALKFIGFFCLKIEKKSFLNISCFLRKEQAISVEFETTPCAEIFQAVATIRQTSLMESLMA